MSILETDARPDDLFPAASVRSLRLQNPLALPTTVLTKSDLESPDDDVNITPIASACSSCHDSVFAETHMTQEGALFDFVPFRPAASGSSGGSETDLCGPGPISAEPAGHTDRLDCCSCHSIQ